MGPNPDFGGKSGGSPEQPQTPRALPHSPTASRSCRSPRHCPALATLSRPQSRSRIWGSFTPCPEPQLRGSSWFCSPPTTHPVPVGAPTAVSVPLWDCHPPRLGSATPLSDAAAWQLLCGLDVGEVKKMFLITASSCLASLHHSQLIKHFLLLSTQPRPASLPPAHRAPAPSWLFPSPVSPSSSFTESFPTQFPSFHGKPYPMVWTWPSPLHPEHPKDFNRSVEQGWECSREMLWE